MPSLVQAVVGLSVLGQTFASPLTLKHTHAHKRDTCATGVHIIVGAPASYPAQLGLLSTLVSSIQSNITGSDYWITPYDQGTYPAKDATPVMQQAIANYTSTCPDTPIVLVGYSRGGIVVMNSLCEGLDTKYMSNVIAATSYGEETYLAGQSYDVGTCQVNAPTYPRAQPTGCGLWSSVIKSWCNWDDEACCATGTTIDPHFTYGTLYDYTATSWIMDQWNYWKQHHGLPQSSSTSSVMSSTTSAKSSTTSVMSSSTTTSVKSSTTSAMSSAKSSATSAQSSITSAKSSAKSSATSAQSSTTSVKSSVSSMKSSVTSAKSSTSPATSSATSAKSTTTCDKSHNGGKSHTSSAKPTTTMMTTTKPASTGKSTNVIPSKTSTSAPAETSAPSEGGNGWHPSGEAPQWPGPQPQWSGNNWSTYWQLWQEWFAKYKAWWAYYHGW